jgi:hypothetical protein
MGSLSKRTRMDADDDEGNSGGGVAGEDKGGMIIPYEPRLNYMIITVRQRQFYNVESTINAQGIVNVIPWQFLDFFTLQTRNTTGAAVIHPRARLLASAYTLTGFRYWKPLSMGLRMSHWIPTSNELAAIGGSNIESTTFNNSPYLMFFVDNQLRIQSLVCQYNGNDNNKNRINRPITATITSGDTAENALINTFGQVDTLVTGGTLTFNHHFNVAEPFAYNVGRSVGLDNNGVLTQNYSRNSGNSLPTPLVQPTTWGHQQMTGIPLLCYKTPTILKEDGSTVGLGGQFLLEKWFTYKVFMAPNAWQDIDEPGQASFHQYVDPDVNTVTTAGGFTIDNSISTPLLS